ncbi:MAG: tetratricopeptide repeat protein [Rubrivivax sp.]
MLNRPVIAALAAAAALLLHPARAADDPTPPRGGGADKLAPARALIADGKWAAAIDALKAVNDSGSADWNNLMGYSHRKARTPDYAAAERYYDAALRIDPRHKGALEYSGELYLMTGNAAKAEARLAALNGVCGTSCEEYKDLKAAIERHKKQAASK